MSTREQLEAAIAALEAQRALLGDAVVDASIVGLRRQLDELVTTAQPEQQRKHVTVLFADVVGFTAMSETMDAEDVADIMNQAWQLLDATIVAHGGRIDKHIGDAVMALWGVEAAREDDPEQAIRAALTMQETLASAALPGNVAMRIGISTGPVLLGEVGTRHEFTAIGDPVNVASRLQNFCPIGGVLIAHDTYRHVRGVFDVSAMAPLPVKGKTEPLQTYVVQRAKPRAFRMATRGVEGIETRMIGRDAELEALQAVFLDAAHSPATRIVAIVGEAGVGKSRLLYEFDNWIELRPERVIYLKGRATPAQQHQALSLFRDLFAYRFDILENDPPPVVVTKFRHGMGGMMPADEADVVGHWLGFDFSASPAVSRLLGAPNFAALARAYLLHYFRILAERQPVAVLFEDIHWADDSSLELIVELATHFTQAAQPVPLFIICLVRPAFFLRAPEWGQDLPGFSRVELQPLSPEAGRALVDEILQKVAHIPANLRELIVSNAEGNPFYVEELIKMLIDEEVIVRGDAEWQIIQERLGTVHVPPTLTTLLQARLDALPPIERDLLQRAAVVGRLFWDSAVADLSDSNQVDLAPFLTAIHRRELIFPRERSSFSGSSEYIFKHALLRDVTYETVLLRLRRDYHARVAHWLEENAGGRLSEYLSVIAEHYSAAGDSARAAQFWERAGDQAMLTGTASGAREVYERALALTPEDDLGATNGTLLLKLGQAYLRAGDFANAERRLELAYRRALRLADPNLEVESLLYLCWSAMRRGDYNQARMWSDRARPVAEALGGAPLAQSLIAQAHLYMMSREADQAQAFAAEGLALARAAGDSATIISALQIMGALAIELGDLTLAERSFAECRQLAADLSNPMEENAAIINLGNVAYERGQYGQAKAWYRAALDGDRALGSRNEFNDLTNLAFAELALGELDDAWRHTRQATEGARRLAMLPVIIYGVLLAGKLLIAQGDYTRALALFGLIQHHPATNFDARRDIAVALADLDLAPEQIEAGLAAGADLDLDTVVAGILAEGGV